MRASPQRSLPPALFLYLAVLVTLAAASLADSLVGYLRVGRGALNYLWQPWPASDYYDYLPRFAVLHTPQFFTVYAYPWVYPAPAAFVLYPFYLFSRPTHWHPGFVLFAGLVGALSLYLAFRLRKDLIRRGLAARQATALIAVTLFLGWPLYFALQRGNIESLLWIAIAAGVFCHATGRFRTAAVLIGAFGAVKLYPLFFLGLLFRKGLYRVFTLSVVVAVSTTVAGLRFLEPSIQDAWHQVRTGVQTWTSMMTLSYGPAGIGPDHSIFGLLRQVSFGGILRWHNALPVVLAATGGTALLLFLGRVRSLPLANQILFLACLAILLPPASFEYTLVYLLIPWAALVLAAVHPPVRSPQLRSSGSLRVPFALFGVVLAPLTFLHTYGPVQLYFEGPVRSVALLGLVVFAASHPVQEDVLAKDKRRPQEAPSRLSAHAG